MQYQQPLQYNQPVQYVQPQQVMQPGPVPVQPAGPVEAAAAAQLYEQRSHRMRLTLKARKTGAYMRGEIASQNDDPGPQSAPVVPYHPERQLNKAYARGKWNNINEQLAQGRHGGGSISKGYGITLERIIAAGGYGIAALVRHRNTHNFARRLCVMKVEKSKFRGRNYMVQEETALKVSFSRMGNEASRS